MIGFTNIVMEPIKKQFWFNSLWKSFSRTAHLWWSFFIGLVFLGYEFFILVRNKFGELWNMLRASKIIFYISMSNLIFSGIAYAYIDPATGGFLIQVLIASLIGIGIFFKNIKMKIKSVFSNKKAKKIVDK